MQRLNFCSLSSCCNRLAGRQPSTFIRENENSCPAHSGSPAGERKTARRYNRRRSQSLRAARINSAPECLQLLWLITKHPLSHSGVNQFRPPVFLLTFNHGLMQKWQLPGVKMCLARLQILFVNILNLHLNEKKRIQNNYSRYI